MTKKTRYFLLLGGFIVFFILAPIIVMYVRGITYDFKAKTFIATGILAVRSDPSAVDIFLNGKLARQNSGDIRFALPGQYSVELKKQGYNGWSKRLQVSQGQVTWANPYSNYIYLFYSQPKIENLAEGVLDFYAGNGRLVYLTGDAVFIRPLNNFGKKQSYALPKKVDKILAADGAGENFLLSQSGGAASAPVILVFNSSSGRFQDLNGLFNSRPKMQFGSGGDLYALNGDTVYKINAENKTKFSLFEGVKAFYALGDSLYFIHGRGQNNSLLVSQPPFKDIQTLLAGLPAFMEGDLFVTFEKQIFLLSDGGLYLAGEAMQKLAGNVAGWDFSIQNPALAIWHSGQLDYYDSLSRGLTFITRSAEPIAQASVKNGAAGAFFIKNNKLVEIELDARDNQNQYTLYRGESLEKFFVDDEGRNVLVLDNGMLKSLTVR